MDSEEQKNSFDTQIKKYDDRNAIELKLTEIIKDQIAKYSEMNSEDEETDQIIESIDENDFFKLLNSITYIGLMVAIEKEFDMEFDIGVLQLGRFQSTHDLAEYILQNRN
jgi:acyl carrier protein